MFTRPVRTALFLSLLTLPQAMPGLCGYHLPLPRTPTRRARKHTRNRALTPCGVSARWQTKTPQPVPRAGGRQLPGGRSPPARKRARTVDFLPA
jgi:hypothetical protein